MGYFGNNFGFDFDVQPLDTIKIMLYDREAGLTSSKYDVETSILGLFVGLFWPIIWVAYITSWIAKRGLK